jgi:hypothetical protein
VKNHSYIRRHKYQAGESRASIQEILLLKCKPKHAPGVIQIFLQTRCYLGPRHALMFLSVKMRREGLQHGLGCQRSAFVASHAVGYRYQQTELPEEAAVFLNIERNTACSFH